MRAVLKQYGKWPVLSDLFMISVIGWTRVSMWSLTKDVVIGSRGEVFVGALFTGEAGNKDNRGDCWNPTCARAGLQPGSLLALHFGLWRSCCQKSQKSVWRTQVGRWMTGICVLFSSAEDGWKQRKLLVGHLHNHGLSPNSISFGIICI